MFRTAYCALIPECNRVPHGMCPHPGCENQCMCSKVYAITQAIRAGDHDKANIIRAEWRVLDAKCREKETLMFLSRKVQRDWEFKQRESEMKYRLLQQNKRCNATLKYLFEVFDQI
jgi:hypothetical protein